MTRHNPTLSGVFINEASWNKLSEDDQKILEQAGVEARQAVHERLCRQRRSRPRRHC